MVTTVVVLMGISDILLKSQELLEVAGRVVTFLNHMRGVSVTHTLADSGFATHPLSLCRLGVFVNIVICGRGGQKFDTCGKYFLLARKW